MENQVVPVPVLLPPMVAACSSSFTMSALISSTFERIDSLPKKGAFIHVCFQNNLNLISHYLLGLQVVYLHYMFSWSGPKD